MTIVQKTKSRSPYLRTESRLADVIAAIQASGKYKYYKLDFPSWADRITGDSTKDKHWRAVFEEHPEFFRLDSARQRASLVLRRQEQKLYDVDNQRVILKSQYDALDTAGKERISRTPLTAAEIEALIDVAISLHAAALERERDRRWWVPLITAFIGALIGGLLPAGVKLAFGSGD